MKIKLKMMLFFMLLTNLCIGCGCDPKAEIEKLPNRPNPAFWTGYQSDSPYYL